LTNYAQLSAGFPIIGIPAEYTVSAASRGPCDGSTAALPAIGGIGTVAVTGTGPARAVDVHATLFFASASGPPDAVHLDDDGLPFSSGCPH
jgi:hypothetical protein